MAERDPIRRLKDSLILVGVITDADYDQMCKSVQNQLDFAWKTALSDPYPDSDALTRYVYSTNQL